MAERIEQSTGEARAQLQTWYLTDLRPKLASAARRGAVTPLKAVAIDRDLRQLLDISSSRLEEAA